MLGVPPESRIVLGFVAAQPDNAAFRVGLSSLLPRNKRDVPRVASIPHAAALRLPLRRSQRLVRAAEKM
jgi:hypothetical protein